MAVIWVDEVCAVCGGTILDGEKSVLISVVKATSYESRDCTRFPSTGKIRINFIPRSDSERKLKHLRCSDDFNDKEATDGEV